MAKDRIVRGLLRLIGWQSGRDRELTEQDADMIVEVAATQPVSEDDRVRLRERVLNKWTIADNYWRRIVPDTEEDTDNG